MEWLRVRNPTLLMRREALWSLPTPESPSATSVLNDRVGRHVLSSYVAYSDATSIGAFEDTVVPVLAALRAARCSVAAVFQADELVTVPQLRFCVERCRGIDVMSLVELKGSWSRVSLEFVANTNPDFLRVGPEFIQDVMTVPEQFRVLVTLAEFAMSRRLGLVARGVRTDEELDAVRLAGIGLIHRSLSSCSVDGVFESGASLGPSPMGTVLPFRAR